MKLEQFILENLEALNQAEPSAKIWQQVRARLDEDKLIEFINKHREQLDSEYPNHTIWEKLQVKLEASPEASPIEDFIEGHQPDFDFNEPPSHLWGKISAELDAEAKPEQETAKIIELGKSEKTVSVKVVWQIAASFLILFVSAMIFQNWYLNNKDNQLSTKDEEPNIEKQIAQLAPELLEAEQYYSQQISQKLVQLRSMDLAGTGVDTENFEQEINQLDSAYIEMKSDLVNSAANERVLTAMIENLQMRMEMLNRQLQILEQVKQIKEGKDNEIQI